MLDPHTNLLICIFFLAVTCGGVYWIMEYWDEHEDCPYCGKHRVARKSSETHQCGYIAYHYWMECARCGWRNDTPQSGGTKMRPWYLKIYALCSAVLLLLLWTVMLLCGADFLLTTVLVSGLTIALTCGEESANRWLRKSFSRYGE